MALIQTLKGEIEESLLEKREVRNNSGHGISIATEYYLNNELVKRDILFTLDKDYVSQVLQQ